MREIFTYGSVGGAPGDRCFYPEPDGLTAALWQAFPVLKQFNQFTGVGPRHPHGEFQR